MFHRRHYETIARVLGAGYYHAKSPAAIQILDLIVKMFVRVLAKDHSAFDETKFKRSIHASSHDKDDLT